MHRPQPIREWAKLVNKMQNWTNRQCVSSRQMAVSQKFQVCYYEETQEKNDRMNNTQKNILFLNLRSPSIIVDNVLEMA